ncbi:glycosyl transferase family 2 [Candidatus Woesearchaeota archaeon]|nr:glycosyl transferase family 2 [Candidatus Woesearchaeota archaeon]|tara:strand:+ start:9346 stop:10068 length:723 start_codon:yes stop_codon:yes gene_type:complete
MAEKIVIVMPAYNAGKTIESVFSRIPKQFLKKISEFIVVNDGSTDDTVEKIKLLSKHHKIKMLTHDPNRGYGAAQKTGFIQAIKSNADIAVLLHSDGQYPPEMLPTIISPILSGNADMVLGSRILGGTALKGGMPLHRYIGNRALTMLENLAYGLNISEYHTGYIAYSKKALTSIPLLKLSNTFHFDGEMILMASKRKLRIKEIGIPTHYGSEETYLNAFTYGIDVLKIIFKNLIGKYNF